MVVGYVYAGLAFLAGSAALWFATKKKQDKPEDNEKLARDIKSEEKALSEQSEILNLTKPLTNETYFDGERRKEFLKEINLMIEKTIDEWNRLFGSDELVHHLEKKDLSELQRLTNKTKIELPDNLKRTLFEEYKIKPEIIDIIERVRATIIHQLNILLSIRDHVKKGGFVSITEAQDRDTKFRNYMLNIRRQLNEVQKLVKLRKLEERGLWKNLQVIKGIIKADKVSLTNLKATQKV